MSPFIDNEAEGYMPDRQREINALAGIETANVAGPGQGDSEEEESKEADENA